MGGHQGPRVYIALSMLLNCPAGQQPIEIVIISVRTVSLLVCKIHAKRRGLAGGRRIINVGGRQFIGHPAHPKSSLALAGPFM